MTNNKTIVYVHAGEWPSKSPSPTFATYNSIGLAKKFNKCYFFIKRNTKKNSEQILHNYFKTEQPDNLIIKQVKRPRIDSNRLFCRKVYKKIKSLIKHEKIDAVVSRHIKFLPYLAKIKNKFDIPTFFESHDFYANLSIRDDINRKKKKEQYKLENKYIPKISGIICLQKAQKKLYKQKFPNTMAKVARTGIHQFYRTNNAQKHITYVGSLDPLKGVSHLIKSLQYTDNEPQVLIIGGKHKKEIQKIKKLVERHYTNQKVKITGWIDKAEMHSYLANTMIGVLPLKNTFFNKFLTSPLKLFDYYSYGIPVIASDQPTTRELISEGESGIFFEPENEKELAEQMDYLLNNRKKRESMSEYIYNNCRKYLWSNRAHRIANIIDDLE